MDAHWQLGTHTTEPRTGLDLGHPLWVLPALAIRRAAFAWLHRPCGMAASDNCCNLAQPSIIGTGLTVRSSRTRFLVSFKCVAICSIENRKCVLVCRGFSGSVDIRDNLY